MTITQYCPACRRVVAAELVQEYDTGRMMIGDTSTCQCGLILWKWRMGQPIEFANKGHGFVVAKEEVRGQMRLF